MDWSAVAQLAVYVELFGNQLRQHLLVPAPVCLCDLRAQFALTPFQAAHFKLTDDAKK